MPYFRKIPVEIEAHQFNSDADYDTLYTFTVGKFELVEEEDRDNEQPAQVFDKLHNTWVNVYYGNWIIQGVKGEFYPCDNAVFIQTYEEVTP